MSQTVMIEAFEQRPEARARALENICGWMQPQGLEGRRVLLLLDDFPVAPDVVRGAVHLVTAAARVDLGARSFAAYGDDGRRTLQGILQGHGSLIELKDGEYESLAVPERMMTRQIRGMETPERRFIKRALIARPLAEADFFAVVRNLGLNRFSGVHGIFATVLDCLPVKTRTEILSYAAYDLMGEALLDAWSALPAQFLFGLFDGERLREETFGETAETGFFIAGVDPDDLDSYALIASGCRISASPFSTTASVRLGKGRGGKSADVAANVTLEELRERVPKGLLRRMIRRGMFRGTPLLRFSARPPVYDNLVCPTGAITEGPGGLPVVDRGRCVGCGWCLKEYAEVDLSGR